MQKHYLIKTHNSHKVFMGAISFVVLIIGILLGKNINLLSVNDNDFKTYTVILLFILNLIIIVLILIIASFLIELKETLLESEKKIEIEEEKIEKDIKKDLKKTKANKK